MLFNILAGLIYIQRGGQKRRNCAASRCDDHMSFGLSNSTKTNRDCSTVFHCQISPHSAQILTRRLPPSKATKNGQLVFLILQQNPPILSREWPLPMHWLCAIRSPHHLSESVQSFQDLTKHFQAQLICGMFCMACTLGISFQSNRSF